MIPTRNPPTNHPASEDNFHLNPFRPSAFSPEFAGGFLCIFDAPGTPGVLFF